MDGDGDGAINEMELECLVLMVHDMLGSGNTKISPGDCISQQLCDVPPMIQCHVQASCVRL